MARILHIAPENWTGVLMDFVRAHRELGHQARLVTLFRGPRGYEEDLCLDLPLVGWSPWIRWAKRALGFASLRPPGPDEPPRRMWRPRSAWEAALFRLRDRLWAPRIEAARRSHGLDEFDIYHLDGGIGLYRDGRDIREVKARGKVVICYYHGPDLRGRGAIPAIDSLTDLRMTCEFDLLRRDPGLVYGFLPIDTRRYRPAAHPERREIVIAHAPTSRAIKGTARVIEAVEALARRHPIRFHLIEGRSHAEVVALKAESDILIDQVADGDMGYGVNSLESLALGVATVTNLSPDYEAFLGDHPFVVATPETLEARLEELIVDPALRERKGKEGRAWVERVHDARAVARRLYALVAERGLWRDRTEPDKIGPDRTEGG